MSSITSCHLKHTTNYTRGSRVTCAVCLLDNFELYRGLHGAYFRLTSKRIVNRELFIKVQKQSFSFFDNKKIRGVMSRLSSDLFDISELAHHGPEEFFIAVMTLIVSFVLMYQVHPTLALLTIFFRADYCGGTCGI